MYKKILFGCVALLFAAATAFNIGLIQTKDAGDISLDAITIMAQAHNGEAGGGGDCRWATRTTWQGWEAICISSGVGYNCSCGSTKPYY